MTAFRDGQVTLRSNRRVEGFTEAIQETGYQGVRRGELVIHSMDGFAGAIGVSESDGKMSPVVHIYVTLKDNPYYLAYALRVAARSGFIQSLAKGIRERSTAFDKAIFKSMYLPRPPRSEQDRIVAYLDRELLRIDVLVDEQERLIGMLRERRWAVVERTVALLEWGTPLGFIATLIQTGPFGSQLKSDEYQSGGIPVINPSHIVASELFPDLRIAVSAEKAERLARHKLEEGDLIIARRGDLGRCAVVGEASAGYLCGTGAALIRLDRTRMDPSFAAIVFSSQRNRDSLKLASVGSTMENLNSTIIGMLRFPVPPLIEQRRMTADLKVAVAKIDAIVNETEWLIELARERRSALIAAAVTGQVAVREMA